MGFMWCLILKVENQCYEFKCRLQQLLYCDCTVSD